MTTPLERLARDLAAWDAQQPVSAEERLRAAFDGAADQVDEMLRWLREDVPAIIEQVKASPHGNPQVRSVAAVPPIPAAATEHKEQA